MPKEPRQVNLPSLSLAFLPQTRRVQTQPKIRSFLFCPKLFWPSLTNFGRHNIKPNDSRHNDTKHMDEKGGTHYIINYGDAVAHW